MRLYDGVKMKKPSQYIQTEYDIPSDIYEQILELEAIVESWVDASGQMIMIIAAFQRIAMELAKYDFDTSKIAAVQIDRGSIDAALNPSFMNVLVYLVSLTAYHKAGGKHEHPGDLAAWVENNQFEMDPKIVMSKGGNA